MAATRGKHRIQSYYLDGYARSAFENGKSACLYENLRHSLQAALCKAHICVCSSSLKAQTPNTRLSEKVCPLCRRSHSRSHSRSPYLLPEVGRAGKRKESPSSDTSSERKRSRKGPPLASPAGKIAPKHAVLISYVLKLKLFAFFLIEFHAKCAFIQCNESKYRMTASLGMHNLQLAYIPSAACQYIIG